MDARNFKDFLTLYNSMTEMCFTRCVNNFYSRKLDADEGTCVEDCASKYIKFNNRLMKDFVSSQTALVNKRLKEAEEQ